MTDLLAGSKVKALDTPPTVQVGDATALSNITAPSYTAGSPEVGTTFTAPTSGRVLITVSGSLRNNGANDDRVFLTAQVFLGSNSSGTEVVAPTVTVFGISSAVGNANAGFQYLGRTSMLDGLTAGATYYVRTMHVESAGTSGGGSNPFHTIDIGYRQVLVAPTS